MQDNIPIRKVKGTKKITFYNHSQIAKQQLKIVMEIARQSSWLTAKTNFGCMMYKVPKGKIPAHRTYTQIGHEGKNSHLHPRWRPR